MSGPSLHRESTDSLIRGVASQVSLKVSLHDVMMTSLLNSDHADWRVFKNEIETWHQVHQETDSLSHYVNTVQLCHQRLEPLFSITHSLFSHHPIYSSIVLPLP